MSRPENPKYNFLNPLASNIKDTSHAVCDSQNAKRWLYLMASHGLYYSVHM